MKVIVDGEARDLNDEELREYYQDVYSGKRDVFGNTKLTPKGETVIVPNPSMTWDGEMVNERP